MEHIGQTQLAHLVFWYYGSLWWCYEKTVQLFRLRPLWHIEKNRGSEKINFFPSIDIWKKSSELSFRRVFEHFLCWQLLKNLLASIEKRGFFEKIISFLHAPNNFSTGCKKFFIPVWLPFDRPTLCQFLFRNSGTFFF